MRIVRVWVTLLGVAMDVAGCAGGPQLVPVTNPSQRLDFGDFSILPPHGENWFKTDPAILRQQVPDSCCRRAASTVPYQPLAPARGRARRSILGFCPRRKT